MARSGSGRSGDPSHAASHNVFFIRRNVNEITSRILQTPDAGLLARAVPSADLYLYIDGPAWLLCVGKGTKPLHSHGYLHF